MEKRKFQQMALTCVGRDLGKPATSALHLSTARLSFQAASLQWGDPLEGRSQSPKGTTLSTNCTSQCFLKLLGAPPTYGWYHFDVGLSRCLHLFGPFRNLRMESLQAQISLLPITSQQLRACLTTLNRSSRTVSLWLWRCLTA